MKVLTTLFYVFIYLVAAFCFVVLLEHGLSNFQQGAREELLHLLR